MIREVCETGFPESVVEKARRQALSGEINGRKTMSGQASRLGTGEVVIGDIHYGRRYLKRLQSVTPQDLQAVASTYLVEEGMSAVTLGPKPEAAVAHSDSIAEVLALDPFELVEFKSGARLLLQEDKRLPKVHIRCVMQGGPFYEPADQRGVTELMAELLTKDTANRSASEISTLIDSIGGSFAATGGNNTLSFAIEVLPSDVDVALDLLSDALTCPIFDEATFHTELEAQIANLKEEDDEILDYGFRKLRERFFGEHPFAIASDGRVADLEQLTRVDVVAHFERFVTAPNVVLSVSGDFDRAHLQARLQPLLESGISTEPFTVDRTPAYPGPAEAVNVVEPMDREQAVVLQAYPDVGIKDERYVVGEMLNELFSGMSSRLFERVREDKGMAYYVGSSRVVGCTVACLCFMQARIRAKPLKSSPRSMPKLHGLWQVR